MALSSSEASQPTPILLIEPERDLALKMQDLLLNLFHESLDLGVARSLREGMTYLSSRRVPLILISLAVSDYKGLDAVRALRLTEPACRESALDHRRPNNQPLSRRKCRS